MFTTTQQTYNAMVLTKVNGDPAVLFEYADGEPVNSSTFNQRQEVYGGLFGLIEDSINGLGVAQQSFINQTFSGSFITEVFNGLLNTGTRRLTLGSGSAYMQGKVLHQSGEVITFGTTNQVLVLDVSGTLSVNDTSGFTLASGEIVVGSWKSSTLTYTPVATQIPITSNLLLENGIIVMGNTTIGDTNQSVLFNQAAMASIDTRSRVANVNSQGFLQSLIENDGVTAVKSTTFTYDMTGNLSTIDRK